ncbi:unnamed protein product [Bursaphelenchus xylophilus]|nr:unnamed protein product [Bursaphelenchus xylophilus]CAG9129303.1 unnamed protein product [Bursaphelenchus xylophilus]
MLASTSQAYVPLSAKIDRCAVCEDAATGVHYNVMSCFGCKTFFRRAIVNSRRYYCEKENTCDVTQRSGRQGCKSCRLQKCFDVGMNLKCLKPRRDRNYSNSNGSVIKVIKVSNSATVKSRRQSDNPNTTTSAGNEHYSQKLLKLINDLTRTDQTLRRKKIGWLAALEEGKKLNKEISQYPYPVTPPTDIRIVEKADMATVTSSELYCLLEWAKSLPFFCKLQAHIQAAVLRRFAVYQVIIEQGEVTAKSGYNDLWVLPNGTVLPKDVNNLPLSSKAQISEGRAWRQDKLYRQMTEICLDEVAMPMRRLSLIPEELVTLKIIMFCQCGLRVPQKTPDDVTIFRSSIDEIIKALFEFYKQSNLEMYEERFGNILLLISGIVAAATPTLESFRIQSLFDFVSFDNIANLLLFQKTEDRG